MFVFVVELPGFELVFLLLLPSVPVLFGFALVLWHWVHQGKFVLVREKKPPCPGLCPRAFAPSVALWRRQELKFWKKDPQKQTKEKTKKITPPPTAKDKDKKTKKKKRQNKKRAPERRDKEKTKTKNN